MDALRLDQLIIDKSVTYALDEQSSDQPDNQPLLHLNVFIDKSSKKLSNLFTDFPDNCYINKSITGCGGTTLTLRNNVNYLILVPYVNLLQSKLKDNPNYNILPVFGESNNEEIIDYLKSDSKPKKIICTYDSLIRLLKIPEFDPKKFKLLVDEAHTLVNLGNFKAQVCENVLLNYHKFKSYVFLTATPTKRAYFPDKISHLPLVELKWGDVTAVKFAVNRSVKSMNTDIAALCAEYFLGQREKNENAHIFYNSVAEIALVIKKLRNHCDDIVTRDDIRIICSPTEKNEKALQSRLGLAWGRVDSINDDVKKINFYTSTAFEGADVYDEHGQTYIVINGVRDTTKVDFHVLVPQICGRIRDTIYNDSITLFVGNLPESAQLSKEEWEKLIQDRIKGSHERLDYLEKLRQDKSPPQQVVQDLIEKAEEDVYTFRDDEGNFYVSDVAQKSELQAYESLQATYVVKARKGTKGTDEEAVSAPFRELLLSATTKNNYSKKSATSKVLSGNKSNFIEMMKEYCEAKEKGIEAVIKVIADAEELIPMYYDTLGPDVIKNLRYRKNDLRKAYEDYNIKLSKGLEIGVMLGFSVGDIIPRAEIKDRIQEVYDQLGIKEKAKATDIKTWFAVKERRYKKPSYELIEKYGTINLQAGRATNSVKKTTTKSTVRATRRPRSTQPQDAPAEVS